MKPVKPWPDLEPRVDALRAGARIETIGGAKYGVSVADALRAGARIETLRRRDVRL